MCRTKASPCPHSRKRTPEELPLVRRMGGEQVMTQLVKRPGKRNLGRNRNIQTMVSSLKTGYGPENTGRLTKFSLPIRRTQITRSG